jgi:FkbM family methyltransferase
MPSSNHRDGAGEPASSPPLDLERVVEAEADVGTIWVERDAHILTDSLRRYGTWDAVISGLIRSTLQPGMTFVDAGANIGYFTILGSDLVGADGHVYAVEPDPINRAILEANLERNGCTNVTVLPYAAWHERTELNLMRPADEGAVTRVGEKTAEAVALTPAAPLDDLIPGEIDMMKVDCELTDHVVVASAKQHVERNPGIVISVEFHPKHDSHLGDTPAEVLEVYRGMGLTPYDIAREGGVVKKTTFTRLAKKRIPKGNVSFDFALTRELPEHIPVGRTRDGFVRRSRDVLAKRGILERGGDLLEHIPPAIRPPIRDRDRAARRQRKQARQGRS